MKYFWVRFIVLYFLQFAIQKLTQFFFDSAIIWECTFVLRILSLRGMTFLIQCRVLGGKTHILVSMKGNGQRTRDGGKEDGKQKKKGQKQWNRAT